MFKKFFISLIVFCIASTAVFAETVVFNMKTLKYHRPSCVYAQQCTAKCIKIEKQQAKMNRGKPCKVCGS